MSKQVSAAELAEIVKKLLIDPEGTGELSGRENYQSFMTDIAQVICNHCGGEIHNQASDLEDVWYIGIRGNDSLPDVFGGVWREYDKEGELFQPNTPEWFEAQYGHEHPELTRADWQVDVAQGDTRLGYWAWVAHNAESLVDSEGLQALGFKSPEEYEEHQSVLAASRTLAAQQLATVFVVSAADQKHTPATEMELTET